MGIPENQLVIWSGLGAQKGSSDTYASIKTALTAHNWPLGMMNYTVYLQGSYPNHTNIRGDSDVDVVVETGAVFYHNVPEVQRMRYGLNTPASFTWSDFRDEVKKALSDYFGSSLVTQGNKCITVAGSGNRLNADVVPCNEYRDYSSNYNYAKGITFWTRKGMQIVNYPKLHLENGSEKNQNCNNCYKPNIRVIKNARNKAGNNFPSYFLECLLYNVPNNNFSSSYSETFHGVLDCLCNARNNGSLAFFICQNRQQEMFGTTEHQTSLRSAELCIDALVDLWNNW